MSLCLYKKNIVKLLSLSSPIYFYKLKVLRRDSLLKSSFWLLLFPILISCLRCFIFSHNTAITFTSMSSVALDAFCFFYILVFYFQAILRCCSCWSSGCVYMNWIDFLHWLLIWVVLRTLFHELFFVCIMMNCINSLDMALSLVIKAFPIFHVD